MVRLWHAGDRGHGMGRTGSAEPLGCSASVDFRNVLITL